MLILGLFGVMYGAIGYPLSLPIQHGEGPWRLWSGIAIFVIGYGLVGAIGLIDLLRMRTVYDVDEEGIQCEGPFGRRHLWWSEVQRLRIVGNPFQPAFLQSIGDQTIRIWFDCLRKEDAAALKALLSEKLAPLLACTDREALNSTVSLSSPLLQSVIGVFLIVCGIAMAIGMPLARVATTDPFPVVSTAFGVLGGLLIGAVFIVAGLWIAAMRLTITDSAFLQRTLWKGRRVLAFDRVSSIVERHDPQTGEITSAAFSGDGVDVTVPGACPGFRLILGRIRQQAPHADVRTIHGIDPESIQKAQRYQKLAVLVGMLIVIGMFAPMAFEEMGFLHECNTIDHDGILAHGIVTRKSDGCGCSSGGDYEIEYTFQANGRSYRHTSPVDSQTYRGVIVGERVPIRYLAANPSDNRATASISTRFVEARLAECGVVIAVAILAIATRSRWRVGRPKRRESDSVGVQASDHSAQ